jgi:Zn-dependent protease
VFFVTTVVLAVFNLVPIPPLDGSKILFAILPDRFYKLKFFLERNGFIILLFFISTKVGSSDIVSIDIVLHY